MDNIIKELIDKTHMFPMSLDVEHLKYIHGQLFAIIYSELNNGAEILDLRFEIDSFQNNS